MSPRRTSHHPTSGPLPARFLSRSDGVRRSFCLAASCVVITARNSQFVAAFSPSSSMMLRPSGNYRSTLTAGSISTKATTATKTSHLDCFPHATATSTTSASSRQKRIKISNRVGRTVVSLGDASSVDAASAPVPDDSKSGGDATVADEIFNLIKALVGAGVLSLPAGIAAFGNAPSAAVPAVALIAAVGALSGYGFALIGRVCSLTGTSSFPEAWTATVSERTSWIPAWSVTLITCFAALAYMMILTDTFQSLLLAGAGWNLSRSTTLAGMSGLVLLPLCLLRNLSRLAPFSLLGTLGMVYTCLAMGYRYVGGSYCTPAGKFCSDLPAHLRPSFGSRGASAALGPSVTILLGMLSTAYMAHFNAPKFYVELKDNTVPRFLTVVTASFAVSIAICASLACAGFLTFGGNAAGLILNNYSVRDGIMGLSRAAVALSLVFAYPLVFVGARDGILDLCKVKNRTDGIVRTVTVALLSSLAVLALVVPDVSFVLAFSGATLGNALIYIFPAIMFRGAILRRPRASPATTSQRAEVKVAMISAVAGLIMGAIGTVQAIRSIL